MTVCTDADIVTTALLAGDDELSKRLVELKKAKSSYEDQINTIQLKRDPANPDPVLGEQKHALDLKNQSVDMQIRQIVNYKILTGDKQAGAYQKLAKSMMEQGRNAGATISLLTKLEQANPLDIKDVAKYFKQEGEDVVTAVNRIKDNIANVGTALAEQEKYLKKVKTADDLIKGGKKTKEDFEKAFKERIKQDKKNIKEGLNPNNFADPDSEWTTIKNTISDPEEQQKAWMQYCLGNAIIGDADKKVLKAITSIYKAENTVGKLTADQIFKIETVEELMARAYTNASDLVEDGLLRQAYKDKLTSLMTGLKVGDKKSQQEYAKRLINTARFADEGAAFSSLVRYDAVAEAARKMGIEVNNAEDFYKSLIKTVKEDTYLDNISKDGTVKLSNGTELTPGNVLELVSIATGDKTLPRLLREGTFSESSLLDISTQLLLGNKEEATKKMLKLISKVKEMPTMADSKELALMTLTGKKIQPGSKKAFFNYRSMYSESNMLPETRKKAEFMERMANANRAEVAVDGLEDLSNKKGASLEKALKELEGGYLIVNDSGWMNNQELKNAINTVNKGIKEEQNKIQVLFPRQSQMSNFTIENGNLIFRSVDSQVFRDIMDKVSIRTLGDATATKELQADMYEIINGMNGDKIRYQASYSKGMVDNTGRKLSDQQDSFFLKSKMRDENGNLVHAFRGRQDRTPGRAFGEGPLNNASYDGQKVLFFSDNRQAGDEYATTGSRSVTGRRIKTLEDAEAEIEARPWAWNHFKVVNPEKGRYQIIVTKDLDGLYQNVKQGDIVFDGNIKELDKYLIDDYKAPINSWNDPRNYECYLYAENPFVIDVKGKSRKEIDFNGKISNTNEISIWAARNGYDGVIIKNVVELDNVGPITDYVVFDQSQIKGVDNLLPTKDRNWRYQTSYGKGKGHIIPFTYFELENAIMDQDAPAIKALEKKWGEGTLQTFSDNNGGITISWRGFDGEWYEILYRTNNLEHTEELLKQYGVEPIYQKDLSPRDLLNQWAGEYGGKENLGEALLDYVKKDLDNVKLEDYLDIARDGKMALKYDKDIYQLPEGTIQSIYNKLRIIYDLSVFANDYNMRSNSSIKNLLDIGVSDADNFFISSRIRKSILNICEDIEKNFKRWSTVNIEGYEGKNINDFIKNETNNGYLPYEITMNTDIDGSIRYVGVGFQNKVYPDVELKPYIEWHSHPNSSFFSGAKKTVTPKYKKVNNTRGDLINYEYGEKHGLKEVGLLLPGGVKIRFPNTKEFRDLASKKYNKWQWAGSSWAGDSILLFYELAKELKVLDKQDWGIYKKVVDMYKADKDKKKFAENVNNIGKSVEYNIGKTMSDLMPRDANGNWIFQRVGTAGPNEADIGADVATKLKFFKDGRTVEQIANDYGIDVNIVKSIVTPQGEEAYGRYGYGIIDIAEIAKESTAPHELFHAVFDIVDEKEKDKILTESMKLFGYNRDDAEEALADAFSEWFRTGEFKYADVSKLTKKEQKTFYEQVKAFFAKLKVWIAGVNDHRAEVQRLFDDMVNMKYLPNEGKTANKYKAVQKYNEGLEESANEYFASMLGHPEWSNPNYRDTLHSMLEDMTGIPIKSLRDLVGIDKTQLWKAVDTQFTNAQKLTGKFKNEVSDVTFRMQEIQGLSLDGLKDEVSKTLKGLINASAFTEENAPLIKQALQDYETSQTVEEWLMNKGRLLSMANGGQAESFTLDELKNIFRNGTQSTSYKDIFFPNQDLTDKQVAKYVKQINDMIFDGLTVSVAQNLVKMGYSLPLDNVREVVLGYLMGNISLDDQFVKAFLYKNGLRESKALMESIIDSAMPRDLRLGYEDALYKLREEGAKSGLVNRIIEEDNPFLADTYSSLVSLINTKVGNLANGSEVKYLSSLLDSYAKKVKEGLEKGLTFEEAQQLKTQLGYALDIFEQDILMPKYGRFLTPDQKSAIRNMKSYVTIAVGKMGDEGVGKVFDELLTTNSRIVSTFTDALNDVLTKYNVLKGGLGGGGDEVTKEAVEKFKEKLKGDGAVVENVNGEMVIVDAREQIKNSLDTMPSSVKGTETITSFAGEELDNIDNRTAYFVNQLLESAKKLDAMSKWETAMMYTIDPELNMYRFFSAFRLVDDGGERVPMALVGNILAGNTTLEKYSTLGLNNILRKDIFSSIKQKFYKDGAINIKELDGIIDNVLKDNTSTLKQVFNVTKQSEYEDLLQQVKNQYEQAFMPYTHLKDIPSTNLDGITDVRKRINDALGEQVNAIREAMEGMPEEYLDLLNRVEITTPTGQTITIQQFLDGELPNWKKAIFDDENITVKGAEEFGLEIAKTADSKEGAKIAKINTEYRRKVSNQYNEVLQSIQNQQRVVTEGERKLTSRMLNNGRSMARKYSLTNRLVEATDMVSGLDEEASRMIKGWLLGWENVISFGTLNRDEPLKRLKETQEAYKKFYTMGLDAVNNIAPKNESEELAQHLCRYFKTLERHLGSADGTIGVTTKADINRAFYNIGEVFLNVRDIKGIYAMQSAIEQNQILKFFRFSKPNQSSYVRAFTRPATDATEDIFGGYREYVSKMPDNINKDLFNDIFGANFTDTEFKTLYQALSGVTYTGGWGKTLPRFLNFINGSNFVFRFLISYPGQLLTIPQQGIAYFLKLKGFEKSLGVDDMSSIDRVRNEYGTLVKAYNEINLFRDFNPDNASSVAYYNRYGTPDIADAYKGAAIELSDDVNDMYGKLMTYQSSWDNMGKIQRSLDAYKDNANNIVDGVFARNFKNIAFLKGIKENSFMQFGSVEAFEKFMKDNTIDQSIKNQLMDAVNASAGRNFRNILGLGFGGLDRAVGGNGLSNLFYGLMQFFNFRGAWGQNIFRNMGETFKSAFKMLPMGTSKEGRDAIATYIAQTPEFTNFIDILFNDMQWTWKMIRYQDNGRWSELDNEYDIADFLDYSVELLNMTSQWWQGINSFGPARPVLDAWGPEGSMWDSLKNPEVYKDTMGVGAFLNSLGKNAGRNWKPMNYFFQAIQALEEGGPAGVGAFLQNQFWKLSFGSLRYMMNEDANDYGYTYEFLPDQSGIPSIIRGEGAMGSDKSFSYQLSNNNTWEAFKQIFNTEEGRETRSTYLGDVWGAIINGSNFMYTIKNAVKAIPVYGEQMANALGMGNRKSPWNFDSFTDIISETSAGEELIRTGRVTPKTPKEVKAFVNQFLDEDGETSTRSAYKPFGAKMALAVSNYNQFGHIKGEEAHSGDKETEFMLSQIRYQRGEDGRFLEKNGKKIETDLWKNMVEYIRLHPADMEATSRAISKEIFKWVEDNNDDPNYLLYQSLIGQGMADMYLDEAWSKYQDNWNDLYGGKKAKDKITKTEAQDSGMYWDNFMRYLMDSKVSGSDVNLVEYLQNLDRATAMNASIKIIKDQLVEDGNQRGKAILDRYIDFYTDSYGNEKAALNSQYASQIRALGGIGEAIDQGNLELMMARASSFANTYLKEDETGLVMTSAITSLINRVRDADISPTLKQEMIAALGENNAEFIQTHLPQIAEKLGLEGADELLRIVNEHIYEWDGAMNAAIGDAIMNGNGESSKNGGSASAKFKSALAVTSKLKNGAGTSGSGYGGRTDSSSSAKWVPYKIDIAKLLDATGGKGYSPKQTDINIRTFKPTVDLSIGKDIGRGKKVQKTQEVKKKKVVL